MILFKFILLMLLVSLYQCRLPDKVSCVNDKCTDPISKAKTLLNDSSVDPDLMSFTAKAEHLEFMKSVGSNPGLRYAGFNVNYRFVNSKFLREYKVLQKRYEDTNLNVIGVPDDKEFSPNTLVKPEAAEPVEQNASNALTNNNETLQLPQQPIETNNVPETSNIVNLLKPEDVKTENNLNKNSQQSVETVQKTDNETYYYLLTLILGPVTSRFVDSSEGPPSEEFKAYFASAIASGGQGHYSEEYDGTSNEKNDRLLTFLVITATSVLLFTLGYYHVNNRRQDGELIATINTLQRDLLFTSMECENLKEELTTTKTKLTGIEDCLFGMDDMVQSLKEEINEWKAGNERLRRSLDDNEELLRVSENTAGELQNTLSKTQNTLSQLLTERGNSEEQIAGLNGNILSSLVPLLFLFFFYYTIYRV